MTMRYLNILAISCALLAGACSQPKDKEKAADVSTSERKIWTKDEANSWYKDQPWIVGANFLPSTAINQLEMWQADTFDTVTINKELGWAQSLGMNSMRVFLHDLAFQQDSAGFIKRVDTFLSIAEKHKIKPLLVIFDSCWDPFPAAGKQRAPKPFVHNSGWVQSPGQNALKDSTQYPRLENYVKTVVAHFANDSRIIGWDVWNEPDNMTGPSYERFELPKQG
jgi:endo-1,4-beta-mannosidase